MEAGVNLTPDQLRRRELLSWLLEVDEKDHEYARQAARDYEKIGRDHGCESMFKGLADRFDVESAARRAARKKEAASHA